MSICAVLVQFELLLLLTFAWVFASAAWPEVAGDADAFALSLSLSLGLFIIQPLRFAAFAASVRFRGRHAQPHTCATFVWGGGAAPLACTHTHRYSKAHTVNICCRIALSSYIRYYMRVLPCEVVSSRTHTQGLVHTHNGACTEAEPPLTKPPTSTDTTPTRNLSRSDAEER